MSWNIGGWHGKYNDAKKAVIEGLDASMVLLLETWLSEEPINIDGYIWLVITDHSDTKTHVEHLVG